jgi:glycerophosphoryl diester phosphodiesterase
VHPENTLEAFRAAYESGCDMVEFDVQLSRDGVPFIFHDDDGGRMTGRKEFTHELDWKELRSLTIIPGPAGNPAGYRIPSLDEFLLEFGGKAFYLEMKVPKAKHRDEAYLRSLGERCAEAVKASSPRPETFLASFHVQLLGHLARAQAYPSLVGIFEALERFREVKDSGNPPLERYSLSWRVYNGYQKSAAPKISGRLDPSRILLWDIKGAADMAAARAAGIYGLCADDVDAMVRVCKG